MLGLIILLLSLVVFLSVKLIDRRGGSVSNPYVRKLSSSLHESRKAYLMANLSCIVLIAVSVTLAIQESQNAFMRAFPLRFQVLFWLFAIGYLLLFADTRFRGKENETAVLVTAL